jgi:hypothetical protein
MPARPVAARISCFDPVCIDVATPPALGLDTVAVALAVTGVNPAAEQI